jgi:uncharacterized protein YrzB (UPF0473 family)
VTEAREVFTLLDEDGHRHEFTLVEVVEIDQRRYAVLQPVEASMDQDEDTAVIFRVENDTLVTIEDDAEIERVVEALEAMDAYDDIIVLDRDRGDSGPGA